MECRNTVTAGQIYMISSGLIIQRLKRTPTTVSYLPVAYATFRLASQFACDTAVVLSRPILDRGYNVVITACLNLLGYFFAEGIVLLTQDRRHRQQYRTYIPFTLHVLALHY